MGNIVYNIYYQPDFKFGVAVTDDGVLIKCVNDFRHKDDLYEWIKADRPAEPVKQDNFSEFIRKVKKFIKN